MQAARKSPPLPLSAAPPAPAPARAALRYAPPVHPSPLHRRHPRRPERLALLALLAGLFGCPPSKESPTTCTKVGETCRLSAGLLGVCTEPVNPSCDRPPCLVCTPQH